jgi:hypothetical protein
VQVTVRHRNCSWKKNGPDTPSGGESKGSFSHHSLVHQVPSLKPLIQFKNIPNSFHAMTPAKQPSNASTRTNLKLFLTGTPVAFLLITTHLIRVSPTYQD